MDDNLITWSDAQPHPCRTSLQSLLSFILCRSLLVLADTPKLLFCYDWNGRITRRKRKTGQLSLSGRRSISPFAIQQKPKYALMHIQPKLWPGVKRQRGQLQQFLRFTMPCRASLINFCLYIYNYTHSVRLFSWQQTLQFSSPQLIYMAIGARVGVENTQIFIRTCRFCFHSYSFLSHNQLTVF